MDQQQLQQFDLYFRRADLDGDGRISGAEAVSFFQASNLPKPVLAQIWMHADQNRTGYLGRNEFYNALKLVTVAQSKRELTPEIVKAALYGPASAKIPPPQINLAALPPPQPSPRAPSPNAGAAPPVVSQNLGPRGQMQMNPGMNQQYFPSQGNQSIRPPLPTPAATGPRPLQGFGGSEFPRGASMPGPGVSNSNTSSDWFSSRNLGSPAATSQPPNVGPSPIQASVVPKPQDPLSALSSMTLKDPKVSAGGTSSFGSDPFFAGDMFSVNKQASPMPSGTVVSSAITPVTTAPQPAAKPDALDSLQSSFSRPPAGAHIQSLPSVLQPNQQVSAQNVSSLGLSGVSAEAKTLAPNLSQPQWPKMTRAGVQKYMKVFMEVDTDRDGKITGEQARNLFMSWRLPREILKQVWDLSDQDNDSMLSLREFCIALFLMERYREGQNLPQTLPNSVLLDETLSSLAGPPNTSYGNAAWGFASGVRPQQGMAGTQQMTAPGVRPQHGPPNAQQIAPSGVRPQQGLPGPQQMTPAGLRPPMPGMFPGTAEQMQYNQHERAFSLDSSHANQLSNGEQNSSDNKSLETTEAEKKVEEKKTILDSREKMEFYRTKMQELVLYKSRCDNRLNEITERAIADKREAELLGKKYEEKYKQVAEIASKLTIEEAAFRDIQERKIELNQAIVKMEQGGSADGILQVRADRIQSDLEELLRALSERTKKHGVHVKSAAIIELPQGWQPGIPEISAVWDEDWDKFDDEGFSFDVGLPANGKSASQQENPSPNGSFSPDSLSNADEKSEKPFSNVELAFESESAGTHSEDESTRSPQGSPARKTAFDSPSEEHSDHFMKSFIEETETQRSFDEPAWGNFDNNDDIDSVWGFSTSTAKESDHDKRGESYFFGSSDFGASPRTDSPQADNIFQKKSPFGFDESVPGSPGSRAGNSPRYSVGGDSFFDNFSRFDSFSSTQNHGFSPKKETLTRFDSMSSSVGFDHSRDFSRDFSFDDSDPFGSSSPFKVSSESHSGKKDADH